MMVAQKTDKNALRSILITRNEMAHYLASSNKIQLAKLHSDVAVCKKCYQISHCLLYLLSVEEGRVPDGLNTLSQELLANLDENSMKYFKKWSPFIRYETVSNTSGVNERFVDDLKLVEMRPHFVQNQNKPKNKVESPKKKANGKTKQLINQHRNDTLQNNPARNDQPPKFAPFVPFKNQNVLQSNVPAKQLPRTIVKSIQNRQNFLANSSRPNFPVKQTLPPLSRSSLYNVVPKKIGDFLQSPANLPPHKVNNSSLQQKNLSKSVNFSRANNSQNNSKKPNSDSSRFTGFTNDKNSAVESDKSLPPNNLPPTNSNDDTSSDSQLEASQGQLCYFRKKNEQSAEVLLEKLCEGDYVMLINKDTNTVSSSGRVKEISNDSVCVELERELQLPPIKKRTPSLKRKSNEKSWNEELTDIEETVKPPDTFRAYRKPEKMSREKKEEILKSLEWILERKGTMVGKKLLYKSLVNLVNPKKEREAPKNAGEAEELVNLEADEKKELSPVQHLREILLEGSAPDFEEIPEQVRQMLSNDPKYKKLNSDQQKAVEKVISAKDFALILGMPGSIII